MRAENKDPNGGGMSDEELAEFERLLNLM